MCWAAREVAVFAAVAWAMNVLPACAPRFVRDSSDGNGGSAGANAGEGGSSSHAGAPNAIAGAGGDDTDPNAGGSSGADGASAGDGGHSATPSGGAGGGMGACDIELLTSGGFDQPGSAWTQTSDPARGLILHESSDVLADLGHTPVSPAYALLLGGVAFDKSSLSQQIAVPDAALTLAVSFYMHIHSYEDDTQVWDSVTLQLSTSAEESTPIATYSNFDANDDWEPFSFVLDATPYRGKAARFILSAETNAENHSTFLLDSFSIVARLCDN